MEVDDILKDRDETSVKVKMYLIQMSVSYITNETLRSNSASSLVLKAFGIP